MAKFIIAHLQNGRYDDQRILKEATAKKMHQQHFTFDPRVNGICLGFYEMNKNGQRIIGHGGDTVFFHSLVALLPERDFGLFVSYNSPGGAKARDGLLEAVIDLYFPTSDAELPPSDPEFQQRATQIAGIYLPNRRPFTTFEKALQLLTPPIMIKAMEDNTLLVHKIRLAELSPFFFRGLYDHEKAVVKKSSGRYYFNNFFPCFYFEKMSWHESPAFHWKIFLGCALILLSAFFGWPILALINWRRGAKTTTLTCLARWHAGLGSLLFMFGFYLIMQNIGPAIYDTSKLQAILVIPMVASALSLASLVFAFLAWKKKLWTIWGRLHYSVVILAQFVFIWWLNYWNLWGFAF